jgi:hypothetical protein
MRHKNTSHFTRPPRLARQWETFDIRKWYNPVSLSHALLDDPMKLPWEARLMRRIYLRRYERLLAVQTGFYPEDWRGSKVREIWGWELSVLAYFLVEAGLSSEFGWK